MERETGFEPATQCLGSLGRPPQRLSWFKAAEIAAFFVACGMGAVAGAITSREALPRDRTKSRTPTAHRPHTQVTGTPHQCHGHNTQICGPTSQGAKPGPAAAATNTAFTGPAGRL